MRLLITGADGFVGRYLITSLKGRGHDVFAGVLQPSIRLAIPAPVVSFNLLDGDKLEQVIQDIQPDTIIHLAAQSMVKMAWENPGQTVAVNTVGTINLVKSVAKFARHAKIINIGSSEEYGLAGKQERPLAEEDFCLPQNPYATSKLAAGQIALQLAKREDLKLIHVRPFNHFGPYQREGFVVSDFGSQIAKIEKGLSLPVMYVGDLNAKRDFTDVRDIVDAYILLAETNSVNNGIYNICSATPHSAQEILNIMLSECRTKIEIRTDIEKIRPSDVPIFIGSANKLRNATGWEPKRDFRDSIIDTLNWWRLQDFVAAATQI